MNTERDENGLSEFDRRLDAELNEILPENFTVESMHFNGDGLVDTPINIVADGMAPEDAWPATPDAQSDMGIQDVIDGARVLISRNKAFRKDLEALINSYSMERGSNTPDHVLASYLHSCLSAFDAATAARDKYYGIEATGTGARIKSEEERLAPFVDC